MTKMNNLPSWMPRPVGYKMLILPTPVKETSIGGLVLPTETQQYEELARCSGTVIAQGAECYSRTHTRYCEVGDIITYPKNAGQTFYIKNDSGDYEKYILINDDEVRTVVEDPYRLRMYL